MKIGYLYLSIAILAEVIATSALKSSEGFTRPLPACSWRWATGRRSTSYRSC
jgi:multidrug transporter EmrE-like cation transporter